MSMCLMSQSHKVTKSQSHKVTKSRCHGAMARRVYAPDGKQASQHADRWPARPTGIGGTADGNSRLPLRECLALYSGRHRREVRQASE